MSNEAKPEQVSGIAKRFAQRIWKDSPERIVEELRKPENATLLKQIEENPEIFVKICKKINGIRFDQRNRGSTLKDISVSEGAVLELLAGKKMEKPPANNEATHSPTKLDKKTAKIGERHTDRGHIISLLKATDRRPLKTPKVKRIGKNDEVFKVRTSIFAGMRDPVGIEISIEDEGVKISETNDIATLHIGDLRITGVPATEISDGKLRGLFFLDVVKIEHSNERGFALYPKLSFIDHLNGTKPVFGIKVDKKIVEPKAGSLHTTPSYNGDILHLEPIAAP